MNKLNNIVKGITLVAGIAAAGQAMAASQGSLGADSTGTTDISLEVVDRVQITNMKDIALGTYSGAGALVNNTSFCVYRNGGDDYALTLTADTAAFEIASATTTDSIAFTARVDGDTDASNGQAVVYNTQTGTPMAGSSSTNCGGSDNASLEVTFAEADLQAASSAADYQATVTVYVQPI